MSSSTWISEDNTMEKSWFSQISECGSAQPNPVYRNISECENISVIIGHRPRRETADRLSAVRKVIRRENKCVQALSLPIVLSYNMRSVWGKIRSLATDVKERSGEVIFLCEVWEKSENRKHKQKIEEMLEMENIEYISTPRPGAKRGGGAAIATNSDKFSVSKLNIFIPKPLEVVWALLRPVEHTWVVKKGNSLLFLLTP